MTTIKIEVTTGDYNAVRVLNGGVMDGSWHKVNVTPNTTWQIEKLTKRFSENAPDTIAAVLTFVRDTAWELELALVTNWLYDKLKGRAGKVKIEQTEVVIEKGEITRIIRKSLHLED